MVFELFVQVRVNTECGLWVDVEGFGSFHPLWYEIKKHKDFNEHKRITKELEEQRRRVKEELAKIRSVVALAKARALSLKKERIERKRLALQQKRRAEKALIASRIKRVKEIKKKAYEHRKAQEKKRQIEALKRQKQRLEATRLLKERIIAAEKQKEAKIVKKLITEKNDPLEKHADELLALKHKEEAAKRHKQIKQIKKDMMTKPQPKLLASLFQKGVTFYNSNKSKKYLYALLLLLCIVTVASFFGPGPQSEVAKKEKKQTLWYKSFVKMEKKKVLLKEPYYHYMIAPGDNLYKLSKQLYGQSRYWPLIFASNSHIIKDVDRIYPNQKLKIPRIPENGSASEVLAGVYIKAYKAYKLSGKANKAQWLLYWSHFNLDDTLLEKFSHEIEHEDLQKVHSYIQRFSR